MDSNFQRIIEMYNDQDEFDWKESMNDHLYQSWDAIMPEDENRFIQK